MQLGDDEPSPFSFLTERITNAQVACGVTYTNAETHRIIAESLSKSRRSMPARSAGAGRAIARRSRTRSCASPTSPPPDLPRARRARRRHRLSERHLAPRLPEDVQERFLRTIPGLENVVSQTPRLCDRVRLRRSARALCRRWRPSACRASTSPARSTARPATRKPPRRVWSPASTPRARRPEQGRSSSRATRAISA